jgi:hypothetical protein
MSRTSRADFNAGVQKAKPKNTLGAWKIRNARRIIAPMNQPEDPLAWWELSGTRRAVAISVMAGLIITSLAIVPAVSRFYDEHAVLRDCLDGLVVLLGLLLGWLELKHSSEANDHRAEHNRLTAEANESRTDANGFREEANRLSGENNKLQQKAVEFQMEVHQLEKKLARVRLYARVHPTGDKVQLLVSNLSEFDLWINQVEVVVTDGGKVEPTARTIGGANRISHGHAEDGYSLYGTLLSINGNRPDRLNMKFHVRVVAMGVEDDPVTIRSPEYHVKLRPGETPELETLKYY